MKLPAEPLAAAQLEALRRLSTCVVASTIETFGVRLRNTGFADSTIRCAFPDFPVMLGYATTARIRSAEPPMEGRSFRKASHSYYDRTDWWRQIETIPRPRIVVIEDTDSPSGLGAFVGEVHAHILLALGCTGLVTNGTVRDVPEVRAAGLHVFAGGISVSHAYAHLFDFGGAVRVGGLEIRPGDLVQGDLHGVQKIPLEIAGEIPRVAGRILERRRRLVNVCRSDGFSVERLREGILKEESEGLNS
jgi:4-hydroxy-4-methyl-2-oxoglutarate aldolase